MNDDIQRVMQSLGFTKYEIAIMIVLYKNGSLKADEIAKLSNVPLTRTYDALENLKRKKFITISLGRPRFYIPEPPEIAVNALLELEQNKHKELFDNFSNQATTFLNMAQDLFKRHNTHIIPESLMTQFSTLKEAEEFTHKLINSAENTIDIFTHVFNWFSSIEEDIQNAIDRGCTIRVLLHRSADKSNINIKYLQSLGIKVKLLNDEHILTRGTIVDNKTVLFIIWATENQNKRIIYRPQISSNKGIVEVFSFFFEYLWNYK